jgi:hypothetical protein
MDRMSLPKRWFEAGMFLSLDLTQPFFVDLWVPWDDHLTLQHDLRALLADTLEGEAYYTDQDARGYRVMEWFHFTYGSQKFQELNSWIRNIVVLEGPDRPGETFWTSLSFRISHESEDESGGNQWMVRLMKEVASFQQTLSSPLNDKTEAAEELTPTEWDERVFEVSGSSIDSTVITASLIAEYNIFLAAWERHCSRLDYAELYQLWKVGKEVAAEVGIDPSELVFPGSWRFELAPFLSRFATSS